MRRQTTVIKGQREKLHSADLKKCVETFESGHILLFPTDTVYGIGCNAFNIDALKRIYSLKGREYNKPLPILLGSIQQLGLVAKDIPRKAELLMEEFWPGPLTLILNTSEMALHATRGKTTVAVRIPAHGMINQMLTQSDLPMAATSANTSGKTAVHSYRKLEKKFRNQVDILIDGGSCPVGTASSVVDVTHEPFTLLREGAISKRELSDFLKIL